MISRERARLLLGTLVSIRATGDDPQVVLAAIEAAFAEIRLVHQLMSFHSLDSDLSRLINFAHIRPVEVHPHTFCVLTAAREFAITSGGVFDITLARELVANGSLPKHHTTAINPEARWEDIDLLPGSEVFFRRPLYVDLGGIAKGFAVDLACEKLRTLGMSSGTVNAGGDLRLFGPGEEIILLDVKSLQQERPCVQLQSGSLASSESTASSREDSHSAVHWNGLRGTPVVESRFVSVAAEECMTADALTKIVLCAGSNSQEILKQHHARAFMFERGVGWTYFN